MERVSQTGTDSSEQLTQGSEDSENNEITTVLHIGSAGHDPVGRHDR